MPELPEVETVCRGLESVLKNACFESIFLRRKDLRAPLPVAALKALTGRRIKNLERRAKYILIHFDGGQSLLLHLGMSGRVVIEKKKAKTKKMGPQKHDHVIFTTSSGAILRYHDPRRFGLMDVIETKKTPQHKLLRHLGLEPLGPGLTGAWLKQKFKGKKQPVKLALLDQRLIAGIGNIYACEALFYAGIHPKKPAGRLRSRETEALSASIKKVLKRALAKGGSSLRDYVQADGELGTFQHEFAVYGKEGTCACGAGPSHDIRTLKQGGRSTFYCPQRQK